MLRFFHRAQLDATQVNRWNKFLDGIPTVHFRQTPNWAPVEMDEGWPVRTAPTFFWAEKNEEIKLTAVVTRRELRVPPLVSYEISKGPVFNELPILELALPELQRLSRHHGFRLRVSPFLELDSGGDEIETALERLGFVRHRVYGLWATLRVDLRKSEEELRSELRRTTRNNIRKAAEEGVTVVCDDSRDGWSAFQQLQREMSDRKNTGYLALSYMERLSRMWLRSGVGGTFLFAIYQGRPVAAGLVIRWRDTVFYEAAASTRAFPKIPTSYLLAWELLRWAKAQGCSTFDLGGYSMLARPGESLWGVNQFKRGFVPNTPPTRYVAVHEWHPSIPALLAASLRGSPVPGTSSSAWDR